MSANPAPPSTTGHGLWHRLLEELRVYGVIAAYLYICFLALFLYKTALLESAGVPAVFLGVALVKALVIGKFVLIGDAIRKAAQRLPRRLLARIAMRVFWLMVLLVLFTLAEELLLGAWRSHSITGAASEIEARSPMETLAELLLMLLILVPPVAAGEVNQALGPGKLADLLTKPRTPAEITEREHVASDR